MSASQLKPIDLRANPSTFEQVFHMPKTIEVAIGKTTYKVSLAPIRSKLKQTLSKQESNLFLSLHKQAQNDPASALKPLEELQKKHPHSPEILNLLTFVYLKTKEIKKAETLIRNNYETNPTDLFARINFADQCLRNKQYTRIPEIFENEFNLSSLYPERELFHASEMSGFATLMSFYYLHLGKKNEALDFYKAAVQADPRAPALSPLERALFPSSLLKKLFMRLRPNRK